MTARTEEYRSKAEALLKDAEALPPGNPHASRLLARAQVYATLAVGGPPPVPRKPSPKKTTTPARKASGETKEKKNDVD